MGRIDGWWAVIRVVQVEGGGEKDKTSGRTDNAMAEIFNRCTGTMRSMVQLKNIILQELHLLSSKVFVKHNA